MFKTINNNFFKISILSYTMLLLFIFLNFFIYSLISISLYKLICYEQQSIVFSNIILKKITSIYYNSTQSVDITLFTCNNFYYNVS